MNSPLNRCYRPPPPFGFPPCILPPGRGAGAGAGAIAGAALPSVARAKIESAVELGNLAFKVPSVGFRRVR